MAISNEKKALAKFLGVKRSEIKDGYDEHTFEVNGEEYFVGDYDASYEAAVTDSESLFDELGLEALNKDVVDYYVEKFCDFPWEEAMHEDHISYCSEIADEEGDEKFANRLVEECVDNGIIDESDCVENNGKLDYEDKEKLIEDYATKMDEDYSSMGDYFESIYGRNWVREAPLKNYMDYRGAAEECVRIDGIANFIARYDGKEHEEEVGGETYYIYRQN